jgi:hypothetical protein
MSTRSKREKDRMGEWGGAAEPRLHSGQQEPAEVHLFHHRSDEHAPDEDQDGSPQQRAIAVAARSPQLGFPGLARLGTLCARATR